MNPAQFPSHSSQFFISPVFPESSSMEIDSSPIRFEDHFRSKENDETLIKDSTVKFLNEEVTLEHLLALLTNPAKLLYSLTQFDEVHEEDLIKHASEKYFAFLTAIETQFLDQLDKLIKLESQNQTSDTGSAIRTLENYICKFRKRFFHSVNKTATSLFDPTALSPNSIPNYSCLSYIPSLHKKKEETSYYLPIKISPIAILCHLNKKENLFDPHFSLKQTLVRIEKEMHDIMGISQNEMIDLSWAPYIELFNCSTEFSSFNYSISDLIDSEILKKINKGMVHEIFSAGLPLFFDSISDRMPNEHLDLDVLSDLLDVLIKYNILHEVNDYKIFSYVSKCVLEEGTSVEFTCDSSQVDDVQHTFDGDRTIKISLNPQIFSAGSEVIRALYEWIDSLLNTQDTIESFSLNMASCTLPLELLFPASLTGKKRKRGESSFYQIQRYPLKFLKCFDCLHLIGKPKQPYHPEEWKQLIDWIGPEKQELSLPLECLPENPEFPEDWNHINIIFSMNKNEGERKKQIDHLNQLVKSKKVIAILDFENNKIPLEVLVDYAIGVNCQLELKFKESILAADFDLTAFLIQIKDGVYNRKNFLSLICALYPNSFTIEQIHLMVEPYESLPDRLTKRLIDLINSEEGDQLFSYPSMKNVHLISDLLKKTPSTNKDDSRLYKKMTSVLLEMTLEAQKICKKDIPDPRSSCDVQQYLLQCITTYPALMDNYPRPLVEISLQNSLKAFEHSLNGKITLQFLQNSNSRREIERLLSFYSDCFLKQDSINEFAIEDSVHLLSLLNLNEVKRDLALYPSTLEKLVSLLKSAFQGCMILEEEKFLKQVEGIVTFIIKREYLTKAQLESLLKEGFFNDYLYSILRSLKSPEDELFVKRLLSVADLFWNRIFASTSFSNKEGVKKFIGLFLKQGWNPPARDDISTEKLRYFLIPFLRTSLPYLDQNKQQWVLYILQGLGHIKPILSQDEQEGINQLLDYFFIGKDRTIQGWDISGLTHYPVISKHLVIMSFSHHEKLIGLIGSQAYANVWNILFTDLLEKKEIHEEEAFHYAYELMQIIDVGVLQNRHLISPFMKTLSQHPMLLEKLLKKSYVFLENPYKRSILKSSGYLAWFILNSNRVLTKEILSLCARALCDRKLAYVLELDVDLIPCGENRLGFLRATMGVLKNSEEYTLKNYPKLFLSLWNTYLTDYALYKSNPTDEVYNTLVDQAEVILTSLLEERSNEIFQSLIGILDGEFKTSPNVMRDAINRLLESNMITIKDTLLGIVGRLPALSDEAQKVFFRLSKNLCLAYALNFSRQPLFLTKRLKYLIKRPLHGEYRLEARRALTVPFTEENGPFISKLLSKLAPLSETELFLICSAQQTNLAQCFERELNEKEKFYLKLSNYKLEMNTFQRVRRFIEKPYTPPIDVNQTSINSLLDLFDLINFNDPTSSNYVNPSFLVLDGKRIEPSEFRANIERLINNVLKREKITAVPENDEERELFYGELHQYLAHMAHILGQQDPVACTASFLALGEIGNKCGTQYLELPGLYHSLVQQAEIPLVPHWISRHMIDSLTLDNYLFENASQYGFMTRTALISRLKSFVSRDISNALAFKVPLKDHEVCYFYALINKKTSLIYYLIETLPFNLREGILVKIANLELNSPLELLKELEKIERVLSIAWLLPYQNKHCLDIPSFSLAIGSIIEKEFKEETESDVSKKFKKLLNDLYTMDEAKAKQTLVLLSEALTGDNVLARLEALLSSEKSKQTLDQPVTLQDKLEILLHDRRWKYLREKLAQHPDVFSVNVHNRKFIEHSLSEPMCIYHAYSSMKGYEDKHVDPKTKSLVVKLKRDFTNLDHNIVFVLNAIKQEISKTIPFGDFIDWFKVHHPKERTWEDFQGVLYNEDFELKDDWLVYMLVKMKFVVKKTG